MPRDGSRAAVLSVLAAAALFSTSGTSTALLAPGAWPPGVGAVRLVVGALGMVAFIVWRGARRQWWCLLRHRIVWLMALGVAGYQAFFFVGVHATGVATGTLVALGAAPFLAGVLGWFVGGNAPGWAWAGATVVAIVGLALLTGTGNAQLGGVLAALVAAASYAVYTIFGARLSREGHDPSVVLAAAFSLAALLVSPLLLSARWVATPSGAVLALWLGLAATTLAYLLFGRGLPVLQPGHIATLTLLEPVGATLWGILLLGESLTLSGWVGCLFILSALMIVGAREK